MQKFFHRVLDLIEYVIKKSDRYLKGGISLIMFAGVFLAKKPILDLLSVIITEVLCKEAFNNSVCIKISSIILDLKGSSTLEIVFVIFLCILGVILIFYSIINNEKNNRSVLLNNILKETQKLNALSRFNLWIFQGRKGGKDGHSRNIGENLKKQIQRLPECEGIHIYPSDKNQFSEYKGVLFCKNSTDDMCIFDSTTDYGYVILTLDSLAPSSFSSLGMIAENKILSKNTLLLIPEKYKKSIRGTLFFQRSIEKIQKNHGKVYFYKRYKDAVDISTTFLKEELKKFIRTVYRNSPVTGTDVITIAFYALGGNAKKKEVENYIYNYGLDDKFQRNFHTTWKHMEEDNHIIKTKPEVAKKYTTYQLSNSYKKRIESRSSKLKDYLTCSYLYSQK